MQFNIGDRVSYDVFGFGTVVHLKPSWFDNLRVDVGISFDTWNNGHSCSGHTSRPHNGWYILDDNPQLIKLESGHPIDIANLL